MSAGYTFPDLTEPIWVIDKRLPPITRWVVLTVFVGLIAWLVSFLVDRHNHNGHKKNYAKLNSSHKVLKARLDKHFPEDVSSSS